MSGAKPGLPAASPRPDSPAAHLSPPQWEKLPGPAGCASLSLLPCAILSGWIASPDAFASSLADAAQVLRPSLPWAGPAPPSSGLGRQGPAPRLEGAPWSGKEPGPLAAGGAEWLPRGSQPFQKASGGTRRTGTAGVLLWDLEEEADLPRGLCGETGVPRAQTPSHSSVLHTPKPTLSKQTKPALKIWLRAGKLVRLAVHPPPHCFHLLP